jgi:hypothetical protein
MAISPYHQAHQFRYRLTGCSLSQHELKSYTKSKKNRIWRVKRTRSEGSTKLILHCNQVKVLVFVSSEDFCTNSNWREIWNREAKIISFSDLDTASDFFTFRPGTYIIIILS